MSVRVPGALVEGAPLVIRELTGRQRSITLRDRAMPHRSQAAFPITQRSRSTWYAGNPRATVQLMGPSFDGPTTFSGVWRDRYLTEGDQPVVLVEGFAPITTAEQLMHACMSLLKAGSTLEVTWSHYRRVGILRRVTPKPDRTEDQAWELEFEWESDGEAEAQRRPGAPELSVANIARAMEDVSDHATLDPLDMLVAAQQRVFGAVAELEERVSAVLDAARTAVGLAQVPLRLVQSVRASATSITFLAGQVIEEITATSYQAHQLADDVGSALHAEAWRRGMAFYLGQLRANVLDGARALEGQAEPEAVRIAIVPATGGLRAVARTEYGSADAWRTLADANGFDNAHVPAGTEVFVPPRPRQRGA